MDKDMVTVIMEEEGMDTIVMDTIVIDTIVMDTTIIMERDQLMLLQLHTMLNTLQMKSLKKDQQMLAMVVMVVTDMVMDMAMVVMAMVMDMAMVDMAMVMDMATMVVGTVDTTTEKFKTYEFI